MQVINYSESFKDSISAQGKGTNFLSITKLESPSKRFDGKRVSYELEYRWLSEECIRENDQSWACVQGSEYTLWSKKELIKCGVFKEDANLFNCFDLF